MERQPKHNQSEQTRKQRQPITPDVQGMTPLSTTSNMSMLQRTFDDPSALTPQAIQQLSRLHGNHYVNRLIQRNSQPMTPAIQRSPADDAIPGTKLWTVAQFNARAPSYTTLWWVSDDTLQSIVHKLAVYHKITKPASQMVMVNKMMDLTEVWLRVNSDDKDSNNYRVMKRFGMLLDARYREVRSFVDKDTLSPYLSKYFLDSDQVRAVYQNIKEEYEGSPTSMFTYLADLIDMAVPSVGKSKIEVEFAWPIAGANIGVAEGTISIGGRVSVEAERTPDGDVKVVSEFTALGVAKASVAYAWESTLKAEVGGFFEVQGDDAAGAMKLLSYGLYRRMSSTGSDVLTGIANYLWSGGVLNTYMAQEFSQEWAAGVEDEAFGADDDAGDGSAGNNYVITGAMAGASLEGKSEALGMEGKGAYKGQWGTRYDAENKGGVGQNIHELSLEGKFGSYAGGKIAYQWVTHDNAQGMQADKLTFEGAAELPLDKMNDAPGWLVSSFFVPTLTSVIERSRDMVNKSDAQQEGGAQAIALDATAATALTMGIDGGQFPADLFGDETGLNGSMKIKLAVDIEDLFTANPFKAQVSLSQDGEISAEVKSILTVKLERSKLLLQFTYDNKSGSMTLDYPN